MATSGTSVFNATRSEIFRTSAMLVGALREGGTMSDQMSAKFAHSLNAMVKRFQAKGLHVWTVTEGTLFPVAGQSTYEAGTGATDHITEEYFSTAITADEASGQTVLSVDDTDDMTVADNIGVVLDDGTIHWSTISSKTSTTVTIASALTDSAAADNAVFNYTTKIVRPIKVVDARRYSIFTTGLPIGQETPIRMVARKDYQTITNKLSDGDISQLFYDPQLVRGKFHTWQAPTAITSLVNFTWWRPIQDFNSAGDNPDLPQEWIDTLEFNLALIMAPQYGCIGQRYDRIKEQAVAYLDDVTGFDREEESIFFGPDLEQY